MQNLDFFGGSTPSEDEQLAAAAALAEDEADRIVVLSDLWLDKPATLDRLRVVLEGASLSLEESSKMYSCMCLRMSPEGASLSLGKFSNKHFIHMSGNIARLCASAVCGVESIENSVSSTMQGPLGSLGSVCRSLRM